MFTLFTYLKARKYHCLSEIEPNQWWTMIATDVAAVCLILITISLVWIAFGWKIV